MFIRAIRMAAILPLFIISSSYGAIQIATGGVGGTYYPFGKQISEVCGSELGGLDVLETRGSLDNINRLLRTPAVKFAIIQYDALLYLINSSEHDERLKNSIKKLRVVMPLYDEEIHIVARKNLSIKDIAELEGKKVAIGESGSGTYVTSRNIIKYGDLKFEPHKIGIKKALAMMMNEALDAAIYVAGSPAKLFSAPKKNSEFSDIYYLYKNKFNILSISEQGDLDKIYSTSFIKKKDYEWMDDDIQTKSVRSVLVTYNYRPQQPSYRRVKKLYRCLYENIDLLQGSEKYHEKWKEVDPTDFEGIQWEIHPAVNEFLNELYSNSVEPSANGDRRGYSRRNIEVQKLNDYFNRL